MRFFLDNTPNVVFAFWIGVCAITLALVMLLIILAMRSFTKHRERRHLRGLQQWRNLFERASTGESIALPALPARDAPAFIEAWNDIHEAAPERNAQLRNIGERVGLSAVARRMLHGSYHDCGMAIIALGHQGDVRDFETLVPYLSDPGPILSLCAARALTQIDSARALELFVPAIAEHENWPDGTVARILKGNDADNTAAVLSSAVLRANDNTAARLVRFLADTDTQRAALVIRQLLDSKMDDHVLSTCLQMVTDRADVDHVRSFLAHPRWHVRMHAATALARLGDNSDEARLVPLLSDRQWWVRYRAAQALSSLCAGNEERIQRIGARQHDVFAREIIQHVLSELPQRRMA